MAGLAVGAAPSDGTKGATRSVESYPNAHVAYKFPNFANDRILHFQ
jgi:hypothetical protein